MVEKTEMPKIGEDVSLYLKEYAKSMKLSAKFSKLYEIYISLFSSGSAFTKILEKAYLIDRVGIFIKLPLLKNEKYLRTSIFSSIDKNLKIYTDKNKMYNNHENKLGISSKNAQKEYSIHFGSSGVVYLILYNENGSIDGSSSLFLEETFFLNLPILVYNILQKNEKNKSRLQLEDMVKNNPTSLIGSVYSYLKKNPKIIELLIKDIDKLEFFIEEMNSKLFINSNYDHLENGFVVSEEEDKVPYLIKIRNGIPSIEFDLKNDKAKEYCFLNNGDYYPALINFKEKEGTPFYLRKYNFNCLTGFCSSKNKTKSSKLIRHNFIEKNKKIKEKINSEKSEYKSDLRMWEKAKIKKIQKTYENRVEIRPPEKNWDYIERNINKKIEENAKKVLLTLKEYIKKSLELKMVVKQEKTVENAEFVLKKCIEKEEEIANILRNIYLSEILIFNL